MLKIASNNVNGNRWTSLCKVGSVRKITADEFDAICAGKPQDFELISDEKGT
jgi:hypothetical protein